MNQFDVCNCGLAKQEAFDDGGVERCRRCGKVINAPIPVRCARCGETYAKSLGKCPACQGSVGEFGRAPVNQDSTHVNDAVEQAATEHFTQAAASAASNLKSAALVLSVLGIIGGIIMVIVGVIPQCPTVGDYCSDYKKSINVTLIALGVVGALSWWWIYALSNAIAARVALAAHEARNR